MYIDEIKKRVELHKEIIDDTQNKLYTFLRYIITLASGLIAVLVSLKKTASVTYFIHYAFCLTIVLLSLGIIFGVIALYEEIYLLKKSQKVVRENILLMLDQKKPIDLIESISTHKIYKFSLPLSFVSFLFSLISLVTYAILIDK